MKDVNSSHPYNATTMGAKLGKNQSWTARAAGKLGLKKDPKYCVNILGTKGQVIHRMYSEEAYHKLAEVLQRGPEFDPYH